MCVHRGMLHEIFTKQVAVRRLVRRRRGSLQASRRNCRWSAAFATNRLHICASDRPNHGLDLFASPALVHPAATRHVRDASPTTQLLLLFELLFFRLREVFATGFV